jgi:putative ABC transport system permease protein
MNGNNHISPPQWPLKVLRFFIKKEYLEEIEGDMEEIFYDNVERLSLKKARRIYTWEMLKLLRPVLLKNLEVLHQLNHHAMFKNYFKISIRGLMKNPLNSFINVFGLAVAIGLCVFAYAFARWTYNTDQFHVNKHKVHLVTFFANRDGSLQQYGQAPRPLGEMLKEDFPQIKKICRVEDRNVVIKQGDQVFHERLRYVDPAFLEMFTFPLKWGNPGSLQDINSIVLNEKMAIKYFGDENPIGRDLLVKFNEDTGKAFKVTGVAHEFHDAHTIEFDFLINFENLRSSVSGYDFGDWSQFVNATLIQVDDQDHLSAIKQGMEKYRNLQNEAVDEDWAITSFAFEPLATLHLRSSKIRDDISMSSDSKTEAILYIAIICLFMLALACFNYINIAIVTAVKRLKEIGVRKTIGASRGIVIVQFLTENLVVTSFALVIGILLGTYFFIPWLENIDHFNLEFTLADKNLWMYLPAVLLFTAIASGIYPSLYISRFQVVGILKGAMRFGTKNNLTKVLLGIQLVLACVLITAGVMFNQNTDYMAKRSWGYEQQQALFVAVPDQAAFEKMNTRVEQNPHVLSVSGSEHHLGKSHTRVVLHFPDRQFEVDQMSVDPNYFSTMGLHLTDGRLFQENFESDKKTVVINEEFAKTITASTVPINTIGQVFKIDSIQYEVIGVVKDFHSYNFFKKVNPAIFRVADKNNYHYLSVRVQPGSELETYKALQSQWAELCPETPFDGGFQEDVWGDYFEQLDVHASVWRAFAFLAVVLASLGLYGLVTLNVAGRVKEFSIRKILGAEIKSIAGNITRQYVSLFVVGLGIGAPISYLLVKKLLDSVYWYHVPVTYSGVSAAVAILVLVLLITVSTQVGKIMRSNPVNGLKVE